MNHLHRLLDRVEQERTALQELEQRTSETIGAEIRRERVNLHVKQSTLAAAIGIKQAHLSALESTGYRARWTRQHLANAIAYLRSIDEQRPKQTLGQKIKAIFA